MEAEMEEKEVEVIVISSDDDDDDDKETPEPKECRQQLIQLQPIVVVDLEGESETQEQYEHVTPDTTAKDEYGEGETGTEYQEILTCYEGFPPLPDPAEDTPSSDDLPVTPASILEDYYETQTEYVPMGFHQSEVEVPMGQEQQVAENGGGDIADDRGGDIVEYGDGDIIEYGDGDIAEHVVEDLNEYDETGTDYPEMLNYYQVYPPVPGSAEDFAQPYDLPLNLVTRPETTQGDYYVTPTEYVPMWFQSEVEVPVAQEEDVTEHGGDDVGQPLLDDTPIPPPPPQTPSVQSSAPFIAAAVPNRPPEICHAIDYVSTIKHRFYRDPSDKYTEFLKIAQVYQQARVRREQLLKTEQDAFQRVAELFQGHDDLIEGFRYFLSQENQTGVIQHNHQAPLNDTLGSDHQKPSSSTSMPGRAVLPEDEDSNRDPAGAVVGALDDSTVLEKIRALLTTEMAFKSFLRVLYLYNEDLIIPTELLQCVNRFLSRSPELLNWFHQKFTRKDPRPMSTATRKSPEEVRIIFGPAEVEEPQEMELDYKSCEKVERSYRILPSNSLMEQCSGRTPLCNEVLNDFYFSCSTLWEERASDGAVNLTFKMNSPEGKHWAIEEERYELDMILESNAYMILALERLTAKMAKMTPAQLQKFKLDKRLGGNSEVLFEVAVHRLYGEGEKARDVVEGLKTSPVVTIPIVLHRLRNKHEEWGEARMKSIQIWRDALEAAYENPCRPALESKVPPTPRVRVRKRRQP